MSVYTNDVDTLRQMISQSIPQMLSTPCITIVGDPRDHADTQPDADRDFRLTMRRGHADGHRQFLQACRAYYYVRSSRIWAL